MEIPKRDVQSRSTISGCGPRKRGLRTLQFWALILCCLLVSSVPGATMRDSRPGSPRQPPLVEEAADERVQEFLRSAISTTREGYDFGEDESVFAAWIRELEVLVDHDRIRLVRQFIHFMANSKTMEEGMLPAALNRVLELTPRELALGMIPYLDSSEGALRKEVLSGMAGTLERDPASRERTFDVYKELLKDYGLQPLTPVVFYMYGSDPEMGLRAVAGALSGEDVAADLLDRDVSRSPATLQRLAARGEWWIRLYVAAILVKEPQENPDLLEKLHRDPNPLIQGFFNDRENRSEAPE